MWWWVTVALAGNPWLDADPDIRVETLVGVTPEQVTEAWSDFDQLSGLFSDECLDGWAVGAPSSGPGARARVTYKTSWLRRRLTVVVREVEPGEKVKLEHLGTKGFFTVVTARATDEGTHVSVVTPLYAPPWPWRKAYFVDVKPAWAACYIESLKKLDGEAR
jgi:uncharacterized protein YndB with AHSA1/START domain